MYSDWRGARVIPQVSEHHHVPEVHADQVDGTAQVDGPGQPGQEHDRPRGGAGGRWRAHVVQPTCTASVITPVG